MISLVVGTLIYLPDSVSRDNSHCASLDPVTMSFIAVNFRTHAQSHTHQDQCSTRWSLHESRAPTEKAAERGQEELIELSGAEGNGQGTRQRLANLSQLCETWTLDERLLVEHRPVNWWHRKWKEMQLQRRVHRNCC